MNSTRHVKFDLFEQINVRWFFYHPHLHLPPRYWIRLKSEQNVAIRQRYRAFKMRPSISQWLLCQTGIFLSRQALLTYVSSFSINSLIECRGNKTNTNVFCGTLWLNFCRNIIKSYTLLLFSNYRNILLSFLYTD